MDQQNTFNDFTESESSVDQLVDTYLELVKKGGAPTIEEFAGRFPEYRLEITNLLEAIQVIDRLRPGATSSSSNRVGITPCDPVRAEEPVTQIGDYRILREAGRGGMGVVYEAIQESLSRRVALKVLPSHSCMDDHARERFAIEAKTAAQLHHSNIVPVFEVGMDKSHYFYAMQFIEGDPLDKVISQLTLLRSGQETSAGEPALKSEMGGTSELGDKSTVANRTATIALRLDGSNSNDQARYMDSISTQNLDTPQRPTKPRLDISNPSMGNSGTGNLSQSKSGIGPSHQAKPFFRNVARAGSQAARALQYAHNYGVVHRDIKPANILLDLHSNVWLTDFGLAKTEDFQMTKAGDVVGTLRYMSPERFRGECSAKSDIYALGVMLFELASLRSPFEQQDRLSLIESIKEGRTTKLRSLDRRVPHDLQTIIETAMAPHASSRYSSAAAMADDLDRFIDGQPIRARRVGPVEKLRMWAVRNPGVAAMLAIIILGSLSAAVAANLTAINLKKLAEEQIELTEQANAAKSESTQNLYSAETNLVAYDLESNSGVYRIRDYLQRWVPDVNQPDLRGWEWHFLNAFAHRESQSIDLISRQEGSHVPIIFSMDYSPDGSVLAYASSGTIVILDAETNLEIVRLPPHHTYLQSIRFNNDGTQLASSTVDGKLQVWDWKNQQSVYTMDFGGEFGAVSWHPNGQELTVIANSSGQEGVQLLVIDLASGETKHTVLGAHAPQTRDTGYSSDGKYFATSLQIENRQFEIVVYETEAWTIKHRKLMHNHFVYSIAWHPGDELIASASLDGTVAVWNFRLDESNIIARSQEGIPSIDWSSTGEFLAIAGWDHSLRVWDLASERLCQSLRGHDYPLRCVRWNPKNLELASVDWSARLNVYNLDAVPAVQTLGFPPLSFDRAAQSLWLQWHPNGELLAAGNLDSSFIWSLCPFSLKPSREDLHSCKILDWNAGGSRLAMHQDIELFLIKPRDGVWLATAGDRQPLELPSHLKLLSWDATGQNVYLAENEENVPSFLWSLPIDGDGSPRKLVGPFEYIIDLDISPDGNYAALAVRGEYAAVIDLRLEEVVQRLPSSGFGANYVVAWSPDSKYLACAGENQVVEIWDTMTWTLANELAGHSFSVNGLSWNPKKNRLASASRDKTIRVWDTNTFQTVIVLPHAAEIGDVQWSPDGQRLASIDRDGEVKIWDASKSYAHSEK